MEAGTAQDESVNRDWAEAHFDDDEIKPLFTTAQALCKEGKWPVKHDVLLSQNDDMPGRLESDGWGGI